MKSFTRGEHPVTGSRKKIFITSYLLFLILSPAHLFAGDFLFNPVKPSVYRKRTVYNLRIRENNSYRGSVYREVRERYSLGHEDGHEKVYGGTAYVFEELKNEGRDIARKIDAVFDGSFSIKPGSIEERGAGSLFPLSTGFPWLPEGKPLEKGDSWVQHGDILVDPLKKGVYTRIGFICQYRYEGQTSFRGVDAFLVSAMYAVRYRQGDDHGGDGELAGASGSHKALIYFRAQDSIPFFIQDNIEETFLYPGLEYSVKGFSHTWYTDVVPMEREAVRGEIARQIAEKGLENEGIEIAEKAEGVSLSINTLHFVPDKSDLLPGEDKKVSLIAEVLKTVSGRSFLVTGHTAAIGSAESQMKLSVERAEKIALLLEKEGIDPERLLFTGRGGTEPAADNMTEEGRIKNRRVEIIILED